MLTPAAARLPKVIAGLVDTPVVASTEVTVPVQVDRVDTVVQATEQLSTVIWRPPALASVPVPVVAPVKVWATEPVLVKVR